MFADPTFDDLIYFDHKLPGVIRFVVRVLGINRFGNVDPEICTFLADDSRGEDGALKP